ncbi:hypothetical protein CEV32_3489 [Brucella rhizosphaerae]|uniref:Uncharacterized protein n=1 Tax=Brucella rhizosphaerae TaxID=571254 RepID=A0A256FT83_9HYPH|nr:hypothetical protein CEV32_3489 [Brucella rhizosphaerae]
MVTANEVSVISFIIKISSQIKGFASQFANLYKSVMDFVRLDLDHKVYFSSFKKFPYSIKKAAKETLSQLY